MSENRTKRARERAGLSIGQAAKILGWDLTQLGLLENPEVELTDAEANKLADVYGVNVPWLRGETPLRDEKRMMDVNGWDELSRHDQNVISEFAASLPTKPPKTLEQIRAEKDKK